MQLRRYLRVLISRKWVVILTADIALLVATLISVRTPPVYTAAALVRVAQNTSSAVSYQDVTYSERVVETYVHMLTSRAYLQTAISRLNLPLTPDQLAGSIKVDSVPSTELIGISANSHDPAQAAAIANMLANLVVEQGQKVYVGQGKSAQQILQDQLNQLSDQLNNDRALLANLTNGANSAPGAPSSPQAQSLAARVDAEQRTYATLLDQYDQARVNEALMANSVSVVDSATPPSAPSKPRLLLNALLGVLLGLLGGIGLAFVLDNLNPTVHLGEDVQGAADLPIIGWAPPIGSAGRAAQKLVLLRDDASTSEAAEAFRRLNRTVLSLAGRQRLRQLLVLGTGAGSEAGIVLVNLATAMAEAGKRVIMVDANVRQPSLHRFFGLKADTGLVDVVGKPDLLYTSLCDTGVAGLRLLPAGVSAEDPGRALAGPELDLVIERVPALADFVLWHCPPAWASAVANRLASEMDAVVLVVRQDVTTMSSLSRETVELRQIGARPLGVIFSGASRDAVPARAYTAPAMPVEHTWEPEPVPALEGLIAAGPQARIGNGSDNGKHKPAR